MQSTLMLASDPLAFLTADETESKKCKQTDTSALGYNMLLL